MEKSYCIVRNISNKKGNEIKYKKPGYAAFLFYNCPGVRKSVYETI